MVNNYHNKLLNNIIKNINIININIYFQYQINGLISEKKLQKYHRYYRYNHQYKNNALDSANNDYQNFQYFLISFINKNKGNVKTIFVHLFH